MDLDLDLVTGSSKTYTHAVGLSCCFRQWRADSHCRFLHGYALEIKVTFEGTPDDKGWIVNFGGMGKFKAWLEDMFDHKTLVAADDPQLGVFQGLATQGLIRLRIVPGTGCENFARQIFHEAVLQLEVGQFGRIRVAEVSVREHGANEAYVRRK